MTSTGGIYRGMRYYFLFRCIASEQRAKESMENPALFALLLFVPHFYFASLTLLYYPCLDRNGVVFFSPQYFQSNRNSVFFKERKKTE